MAPKRNTLRLGLGRGPAPAGEPAPSQAGRGRRATQQVPPMSQAIKPLTADQIQELVDEASAFGAGHRVHVTWRNPDEEEWTAWHGTVSAFHFSRRGTFAEVRWDDADEPPGRIPHIEDEIVYGELEFEHPPPVPRYDCPLRDTNTNADDDDGDDDEDEGGYAEGDREIDPDGAAVARPGATPFQRIRASPMLKGRAPKTPAPAARFAEARSGQAILNAQGRLETGRTAAAIMSAIAGVNSGVINAHAAIAKVCMTIEAVAATQARTLAFLERQQQAQLQGQAPSVATSLAGTPAAARSPSPVDGEFPPPPPDAPLLGVTPQRQTTAAAPSTVPRAVAQQQPPPPPPPGAKCIFSRCSGCDDFSCILSHDKAQLLAEAESVLIHPDIHEADIVMWMVRHDLCEAPPAQCNHVRATKSGVQAACEKKTFTLFVGVRSANWRCRSRSCRASSPAFPFGFSPVGYLQFLLLYLAQGAPVARAKTENRCKLGDDGVTQALKGLCETAMAINADALFLKGMAWTNMQWDETFFSQRKFHQGARQRTEGILTFVGGVTVTEERFYDADGNPTAARTHVLEGVVFGVPTRARVEQAHLMLQVTAPGAEVTTDAARMYNTLTGAGRHHRVVNHRREFVTKSGVHTNAVEGFWAQLKKRYRALFRGGGLSGTQVALRFQLVAYIQNLNLLDCPPRFSVLLLAREHIRLTFADARGLLPLGEIMNALGALVCAPSARALYDHVAARAERERKARREAKAKHPSLADVSGTDNEEIEEPPVGAADEQHIAVALARQEAARAVSEERKAAAAAQAAAEADRKAQAQAHEDQLVADARAREAARDAAEPLALNQESNNETLFVGSGSPPPRAHRAEGQLLAAHDGLTVLQSLASLSDPDEHDLVPSPAGSSK